MTQSRLGSLIESVANIAVGLAVSVVANILVLPHYGYSRGVSEAVQIGAIYTAISLARSYVLRRWFNGLRFGNYANPP